VSGANAKSVLQGRRPLLDMYTRFASLLPLVGAESIRDQREFHAIARYRTECLHLVAAHLVVVQVFEPLAKLVGVDVLGAVGSDLGVGEDVAVDVDRAVPAKGQGDGVGGAGVEGDGFACLLHPDDRVEGVAFEFGDDDLLDDGVEASRDIAQEVVRHGAWRGCLVELERDGIGFEDADPDGEDHLAADVLEDDDGHVGDGVHHQAADLHLDLLVHLEGRDLLGDTHWMASPTRELGKVWVMRTER
jgi:hypothetical protein